MKNKILLLISIVIITLIGCTIYYTQAPSQKVTLLFAGDLMQHKPQVDAARKNGTFDYTDTFKYVKSEIESADIAIADFEGSLMGEPYEGYPHFSTPIEFIQAMKDTGFDVILRANNHSVDFGQIGLEKSIDELDKLDILQVGIYKNRAEWRAKYPLIIEKNGIKIAILNYTEFTNDIPVTKPNIVNMVHKEQMIFDINKAKALKPDVIIACMHWGPEYRSLPAQKEVELANWLIKQGVDHVIGSHPHFVQPIVIKKDSKFKKHIVAYSLGDFISNIQNRDFNGGIILKFTLEKKFNKTNIKDYKYAFTWLSRPKDSGKKNFEIYPASFINKKDLAENEFRYFNSYLENVRKIAKKHTKGIKEYEF